MMIERSAADVDGSGFHVDWGNGTSRRYLTRKDGTSFTVTDTTVRAGTSSRLAYRNHTEACLCVEGKGSVEFADRVVMLEPDVLYCVTGGETHILHAETDLRLICVFSPALDGHEAHQLTADDYSSYP